MTENDEDSTGDLSRANIRIPRSWWDAWGRICERHGTTRSARILEIVEDEIIRLGDPDDQASLEAGRAEKEKRAERKRRGRPPTSRSSVQEPPGSGAAQD